MVIFKQSAQLTLIPFFLRRNIQISDARVPIGVINEPISAPIMFAR